MAWRGPALTALCFLALAVPGAATAGTAAVDVVTVPGEEDGEIQARTWRAEASDAYAKRVTFDVPAAIFDGAALSALRAAEGSVVGSVSAEVTNGVDASSVGSGIVVAVGACKTRARCVPLRIVPTARGRVRMTIRASTSDSTGGGVVWIELRLRNVETAAGSLFRARPEPRVLDTRVEIVTCSLPAGEAFERCGPDGRTVVGRVREVLGDGTLVTLRPLRTRTTYGGSVTFAGRVYRAGRPSPDEEIVLEPYWRATGFDPSPGRWGSVQTTTGPDGSFRATLPLRSSTRWSAKAAKPATAARPALATLAAATPKPVWVHAPRPEIEIVRAQRLRSGRTHARIVVSSPLAGEEELTAVLVVGRRRLTKRFHGAAERVAFVVTGRTGSRVQAYVLEPHPSVELGYVSPRIAAGWSKRLRLAARRAG